MFIDVAKIYVKSGDGGKGCKSFYRDKYTRRGIPDGGDGGNGSDIIIRADRNLLTLLDFKYNRHFYGKKGQNGSSKNKKGKDAEPLVMRVPVGTQVKEAASGYELRSLDSDGQELVAAKGGRGGRGNTVKMDVIPPQPGEEKELVLELKLIADAGVIGFPNAGKSTLIGAVSNARPAVAAYPFTTKFPVLGVVRVRDESTFVVADIPGLIEGSSQGRGLGDRFLRHVEKASILIHLIDMAGVDGRDPLTDYKTLNEELKAYSPRLYKKKQILAANKMDLPEAAGNLSRFKASVRKKIFPISALRKEGISDLVDAIHKSLSARRL